MNTWIDRVSLAGEYVSLEPLTPAHEAELSLAVQDGELWRLWYTYIPRPEKVAEYIADALSMAEREGALTFVVRLKSSGQVVGCTRYFAIDAINKRLEIGHTWYAKSVQRSAVNTETKLLLLSHAFESLGVIAVEFRTHWHNQASRSAIARLGAKQDGILRSHQRSADGLLRDTVVFSIIECEWPVVKKGLSYKLGRAMEKGK
ncbi:MAG: GNAT family N-acetyltransferase [Pseudomonadales bacterium]|nr:GNAT family N-acetyltransferase [Pseudomonadales bacterium]